MILKHHIVNGTELFVEDMLKTRRFKSSADQFIQVSVSYQVHKYIAKCTKKIKCSYNKMG